MSKRRIRAAAGYTVLHSRYLLVVLFAAATALLSANGKQTDPLSTGNGTVLAPSKRMVPASAGVLPDNKRVLPPGGNGKTQATSPSPTTSVTSSPTTAVATTLPTATRSPCVVSDSTLGCNGPSITSVPPGIGRHVGIAQLTLLRTKIRSIPSMAFFNFSFTRLTKLSIWNNGALTSISPGAFAGLPELSDMSIWSNDVLTSISPGAFAGLQKLKEISLRFNKMFSSIQPGVFDGLSLLGHLTLTYNNLTSLPAKSFLNLPKLTLISLDHNSIAHIDSSAFGNVPILSTVYLHHNKLAAVTSGMLDGAQSVKRVYFQYNKISFVDPAFFNNLTSLISFFVNNNLISTLDVQTFRTALSLENLALNANKLSHLRSGLFTGLTNLFHLALTYNQLTSISPTQFSDTTNMGHLSMNLNKIARLDVKTFQSMSKLTSLKLEVNSLTSLPEGIFHANTNLLHLSLAHNKLLSLPKGLVVQQYKLRALDLAFNQLDYLPLGVLPDTSDLTVNVSVNNIRYIQSEVIEQATTLIYVNNPFHNHLQYTRPVPALYCNTNSILRYYETGALCWCKNSERLDNNRCVSVNTCSAPLTEKTLCEVFPNLTRSGSTISQSVLGGILNPPITTLQLNFSSCPPGTVLTPNPCYGSAPPLSVLHNARKQCSSSATTAYICACPTDDVTRMCQEPLRCGSFGTFGNGTITYSNASGFFSADFACAIGFKMHGAARISCNYQGQWSSPTPHCVVAVNCPSRAGNTLANGKLVEHGRSYKSNGVHYRCNVGFKLVGDHVAQCTANATWSAPSPTCDPISCPSLGSPSDGQVVLSGGLAYRSIATYQCSVGYYLKGNSSSSCLISGQWSSPLPVCTIRKCSNPGTPANGGRTLKSLTFGSIAEYTCNVGYMIRGQRTSTCNYQGHWSSPPPTCNRIACPPLVRPANGALRAMSVTYNSTAVYTCNRGYTLTGFRRASCLSSGHWSHPAPACILTHCPAVGVPKNGAKSPHTSTYLSTVHFSCHQGFKLSGSRQQTCMESGQWQPDMPVCKPVACPVPAIPQNGYRSAGPFFFPDQVIFGCNSGYRLMGSTKLTCTNHGNWSAAVPKCQRIICPDPGTPRNATRTLQGNQHDDLAIYECPHTYLLEGARILRCTESGNWSENLPVCKSLVDPPPQASQSNGNSSLMIYIAGGSAGVLVLITGLVIAYRRSPMKFRALLARKSTPTVEKSSSSPMSYSNQPAPTSKLENIYATSKEAELTYHNGEVVDNTRLDSVSSTSAACVRRDTIISHVKYSGQPSLSSNGSDWPHSLDQYSTLEPPDPDGKTTVDSRRCSAVFVGGNRSPAHSQSGGYEAFHADGEAGGGGDSRRHTVHTDPQQQQNRRTSLTQHQGLGPGSMTSIGSGYPLSPSPSKLQRTSASVRTNLTICDGGGGGTRHSSFSPGHNFPVWHPPEELSPTRRFAPSRLRASLKADSTATFYDDAVEGSSPPSKRSGGGPSGHDPNVQHQEMQHRADGDMQQHSREQQSAAATAAMEKLDVLSSQNMMNGRRYQHVLTNDVTTRSTRSNTVEEYLYGNGPDEDNEDDAGDSSMAPLRLASIPGQPDARRSSSSHDCSVNNNMSMYGEIGDRYAEFARMNGGCCVGDTGKTALGTQSSTVTNSLSIYGEIAEGGGSGRLQPQQLARLSHSSSVGSNMHLIYEDLSTHADES
ncbi:uncharacterized protein LOC135826660 [Sycon ciliatum]|uniref:uncharacterized protein LOC135826660 n=1 Tax=Sycon ciliatum TaxID=27933 RepID=UPI0031F6DCFC